MTAQRAWGWDLDEMREAAMMNDSTLDGTSNAPDPAPQLFGFTPINRPGYCDTAPTPPKHEDAAIKSDKPRAPKRRKTQPSAATTPSEPKKATSSNKAKTAKTVAQLDISQGLSRTKPTSSQDGALPVKTGLPLGNIQFEQNPKSLWVGDTSVVDFVVKPAFNGKKKQGKPSGLADKYQAAYDNVQGNAVNQATPPTPPKSDEVEAKYDHNDQSHDQDSATERQASSNIHVEPSIQRKPEPDCNIIVRDFGAPPFTQTSPPTLRGRRSQGTMMVYKSDPLDSIADNPFEVDDGECNDHGEEDEFPMDDQCLHELMQSMAVPAKEGPLGSDWQPQDISDDTLYTDEQLENRQPHWSGAIPDSDGVVKLDEEPSLMAGKSIDIPSSPQWNFQASCILSHITGNANPDRARTSEASQNYFDDNDLDDGLIDLTVDEIKDLEVTSPVTAEKRPLSPKLQWLSPQTYKSAKSSRMNVSPTDDPHFVSVNSNGVGLPFMRPHFPKAVRDRSPILGVTNRTVLRICFRIGEALNAAAVALRTNVDAMIELYALVVSSSREASGGYKQYFQFADIFTDKPPYLNGTYTFWKGVILWDNDSKGFVGEQGRGKMARVLGRIKRKEPGQGNGRGVEMAVLSIWEVDWEDVGVAKGIACPKEMLRI